MQGPLSKEQYFGSVLLQSQHQLITWQQVNDRYGGRCEHVLHVIDLVLSLPASSSMCERGFSQMKLMKSSMRNKLTAAQMTCLMTVKFHGDSIEQFNPTAAIHRWNQTAQRARQVN